MGKPARQVDWPRCLPALFKSRGGRYKRICKRVKGQACPLVYQHRLERLAVVEQLAQQGKIDLFYADESQVSSEGYVPYSWQFAGEQVCVLAQRGYKINCWGLISRINQCHWATSYQSINAQFVLQELDKLSFTIHKETVVVLDCACTHTHTSKLIQQRLSYWQQRGLFLLFLPPYSPHLNLAETLWPVRRCDKLKTEWLRP